MSETREPRTVCIVNHNGEKYLPATLAAVRGITGPEDEVILVDDASTDGGIESARRDFPDVRIVELPENRGPGCARNVGYRDARHDRILFLDNDVMPEPDAPDRLDRALAEWPDAAIAMARIVDAADPAEIHFDGAWSHFIGIVGVEGYGPRAGAATETRPIGSLISCCFLVDRGRRGAADLFDEALFLYQEDHEAGLRTLLTGHEIVTVPSAICRHGEGTVGVSLRETGEYTGVRITNTIRNRWYVILKLYRLRTLLLLSPALLLFELFQLAGSVKKGWILDWIRCVVWLGRRVPELFRKRRDFQRARKRGDGEVLTGGPIPFSESLGRGGLERAAVRVLDRLVDVNWRLVRREL